MWKILICLILITSGQSTAEPILGDAKSIKVTFHSYQRSEVFEGGKVKTTTKKLDEPFSVFFDSITYPPKTQSIGKARLVATSVADVLVINKGTSMSFLELLPVGTTNITVIFPPLVEGNKTVAVMSKHIIPSFIGEYESETTQYFGYAQILE